MDIWIYWFPFLLLAVGAYFKPHPGRIAAYTATAFLVIWVGLRHEVGDDWSNYLLFQEQVKGVNLFAGLQLNDPGYALLNWLGANGFGGIYFVNLACAALAVIPLVLFCSRQPNPSLALLVAIPYVVTVVFMGYTRQSVAVGLGMLAMLAVEQQRVRQYLLFVTAAALFHKTAVCLFVFAPALFAGRWDKAAALRSLSIGLYAVVLTALVLWREAASLIQQYIVSTGDLPAPAVVPLQSSQAPVPPTPSGHYSAGALVRLAQSVVAAGCFAFIAWRTTLPKSRLWLWTTASIVVVCLFVLAFWRSTLADRAGLFFVPLQLYAFSTLPSLFKRPLAHLLQGAIIICSAAAFWVWLTYGDNAPSWLPYRSVLEFWL